MLRAEMKMIQTAAKFHHWFHAKTKPKFVGGADSVSEMGRRTMERADAKQREVIARFDDWFNAKYARMSHAVTNSSKAATTKASRKTMDPVVTGLVGCGTGAALMDMPYVASGVLLWAALRTLRRYVVMCVETGTTESLFRWAPEGLQRHKLFIINHLHNEVASAKGILSGEKKYRDLSHLDDGYIPEPSKPKLDLTPEELWKDAMNAICTHEYVKQVMGEQVRAIDEPAHILYRIVQGMPEIYMSWNIAGEKCKAEIQVKAFGPVVDFIYVFPRGTSRYDLDMKGFVIRPKGTWYMNYDSMPGAGDRPDGPLNKGFGPFGERKGAFEQGASDFHMRTFRE